MPPERIPSLDIPDVTFLVGAGGSKGAGLPLAGELLAELLSNTISDGRLRRKLLDACGPASARARHAADYLRFEMVMSSVAQLVDGDLELLQVFGLAAEPSPLQRRLAALAAEGSQLVTVNFDDLLEQAARREGLTPRTVDAFAAGGSLPAAGAISVLKLHGSLWRHGGGRRRRTTSKLQATIEAIASRSQALSLHPRAFARLDAATRGRTLVVLGYSAGDDLDVVPALTQLHPAAVVWIEHAASPDVLVVQPGGGVQHSSRDSLLRSLVSSGCGVWLLKGRAEKVLGALGLGPVGGGGGSELPWREFVRTWANDHRREISGGWPLASALLAALEDYPRAVEAVRRSRGQRSSRGSAGWTAPRRAPALAEYSLLGQVGDLGMLARMLHRTLASARAAGDVDVEGNTLHVLGRIQADRDRPDAAITAYREALALTDETSSGWAQVAMRLANVLVYELELNEAERLIGRALPTFERLGFISDLVDALQTRGMIRRDLGALAGAIADFAAAETYALRFPMGQQAFAAMAMKGEAQRSCGLLREAAEALTAAIALARQAPAVRYEVAVAHSFLGHVHLDSGEPERAAGSFRRAITLLRSAIERRDVAAAALARLHLAEVHLRLGRRDRALVLLQRVRRVGRPLQGEGQKKLRLLDLAVAHDVADPGALLDDLDELRRHHVPVFVNHCITLRVLGVTDPLLASHFAIAAELAEAWGNLTAAGALRGE